MTPDVRALYQRVILDHNARPHHHGPLPARTHEATIHNPLCGDTITLRLRLEGDQIAEAWFEGDGCALSRASASLLTIAVAGKPSAEAEALAAALDRAVSRGVECSEGDRASLGDLISLEGVREAPSRKRCATLPWEALRKALSG